MYKVLKVAKLLKELRKENGFTQEDIARMLDIPQAGYAMIETGKQKPTLNHFLKFRKLYKKSLDELIDPK